MSLDNIKLISDIILPIGGLIAFFLGVWQYFHSKSLDVFDRYCEKYNSIITPAILKDWNEALEHWPPIESAKKETLENAMLAYLNLVWEEFYLHDEGLIRKGAWKAWRTGIDQTIKTEFARSVLLTYRKHFSEFDPTSNSHKIADELGITSLEKA